MKLLDQKTDSVFLSHFLSVEIIYLFDDYTVVQNISRFSVMMCGMQRTFSLRTNEDLLATFVRN